MPLRKRLEKIILFNGQPLNEVKNSRVRRAMLNTIEHIVTDAVLLKDVVSAHDAVCNVVNAVPDSLKNCVFETKNISDNAKTKIEQIYLEQLNMIVGDIKSHTDH